MCVGITRSSFDLVQRTGNYSRLKNERKGKRDREEREGRELE